MLLNSLSTGAGFRFRGRTYRITGWFVGADTYAKCEILRDGQPVGWGEVRADTVVEPVE